MLIVLPCLAMASLISTALNAVVTAAIAPKRTKLLRREIVVLTAVIDKLRVIFLVFLNE